MVCTIRPRLRVCVTTLTFLVRRILGILVVLFFQCMAALLNPANRERDGIKWGLVSYTGAMFSFATILTGMQLDIRSISFIDNREFGGVDGVAPPGPLGYQSYIWSGVLTLIPDLMFILNSWLADAFLVGPVSDALSTHSGV